MKTAELYTLNRWIVWYVNYILIKLFFKGKKKWYDSWVTVLRKFQNRQDGGSMGRGKGKGKWPIISPLHILTAPLTSHFSPVALLLFPSPRTKPLQHSLYSDFIFYYYVLTLFVLFLLEILSATSIYFNRYLLKWEHLLYELSLNIIITKIKLVFWQFYLHPNWFPNPCKTVETGPNLSL